MRVRGFLSTFKGCCFWFSCVCDPKKYIWKKRASMRPGGGASQENDEMRWDGQCGLQLLIQEQMSHAQVSIFQGNRVHMCMVGPHDILPFIPLRIGQCSPFNLICGYFQRNAMLPGRFVRTKPFHSRLNPKKSGSSMVAGCFFFLASHSGCPPQFVIMCFVSFLHFRSARLAMVCTWCDRLPYKPNY